METKVDTIRETDYFSIKFNPKTKPTCYTHLLSFVYVLWPYLKLETAYFVL